MGYAEDAIAQLHGFGGSSGSGERVRQPRKPKAPAYGLTEVQTEMKVWQEHNFEGRPAWQPLLGVGEEVGELNHAFLKKAQNIRGTADEHDAAIKDALGDILIFMCDFANSQGLSLTEILHEVWSTVRLRNWRPEKGELPWS